MLDQLIEKIKTDEKDWVQFKEFLTQHQIPAKHILLAEGEVSERIYFIRKGCLRLWFNKDGKDITFQFFFEGQGVASIESFMSRQPGLFNLESIEPCTLFSLSREGFYQLQERFPQLKEGFQQIVFSRFRNYSTLFLSRIKDSPHERYLDLIKNNPEIVKRVPQHYIASYLGITPISLSRIRNRK